MAALLGGGGTSNRPLPRKYLSYSEDGNSRLHFACHFGDYKLALMLLLSPNVDTEVCNIWHETPLHQCAAQGHLEIMMLLLDGGADVNALDKDYYTPLHHAIIHGNKEATELLLCYGANVYNADKLLLTSLNPQLLPGATLADSVADPPTSVLPKSPIELATSVHVCHNVIEQAQGCVWSLQHYCRLAIRKFLGVGKRKRIKELPLPRHLISYLMSLPLQCSERLHDNWDRIRISNSASKQRSRPLKNRDGSKFDSGASLQALKTL